MKNALITASTKGMGRATAIAFAKQGISLAICSRHLDELDAFKAELAALNPAIKIYAAVADCSIKEQVIGFAAAAEKGLGTISIVINNAGIFEMSSILDDKDDAFQKNINTNLMPAYELYRYFGKKMAEAKEGHFFNICSVAALVPIPAAGTYSVTKFALLGLTKTMKLEMEQHGVKVTAVIPGSTLTDSWKGVDVDKNKMVLPEDVASAIVNIYNMSPGANVDEIIIKPVFGQI